MGGFALAIAAAILVRGRIPAWLFDFQVAVNRSQLRAISYLLLLTDDYPPFEGEHAAHYDVPYPDRPTRWKVVVWKLITAIPYFVALLVLTVGLLMVTVVGWLALVVTGRYPQPLHRYATGVIRWQFRVLGYVRSLTDQFPRFRCVQRRDRRAGLRTGSPWPVACFPSALPSPGSASSLPSPASTSRARSPTRASWPARPQSTKRSGARPRARRSRPSDRARCSSLRRAIPRMNR